MVSFWERQSFLEYDYIIVGGGIVGISTAISLKETEPAASVLVLERGILPTGASTKNAGFACFGSLTEILADIDNMGEAASLALVEERCLGLKMLRKRLGDKNIDYKNFGGYELISESDYSSLNQIDSVNALLKPLFKADVFSENTDLVKNFKFNSSYVKTVVFNPFEGQLDTGKMMSGLINYASSLNIKIHTGAEVTEILEENGSVRIQVSNPVTKSNLQFKAGKVAVCTNAFANKLYPQLKVNPGRGVVLITKQISGLPFKGTFHMDEGFYYFRNYNKRIIFGGGRNLDFKRESTTEFEVNEQILRVLKEKLANIILPDFSHEIDMIWSGIMGFGPDKQPVIQFVSPRIVAGVGLGGMGIAIGTRVGERLSKLLLQ